MNTTTKPRAPVLRLRIHSGIPVAIVEDDGVGAGEVDAQAAAARRQDEDEDALVCVEALHQQLPLLHLGGAVQPQVAVPVIVKERLQHVQHLRHLREDEHAMLAGLELPQQDVQRLQLAAVVLNEPHLRELNRHARRDGMQTYN